MQNDSKREHPHKVYKLKKSYAAWIKVGYELFAKEGPEGIQVERLARIINLNKSGFYHYFGNSDTYFKHLMEYHLQQVSVLEKRVKTLKLFPDGIQILAETSFPLLMQKQLQHHHHIPLFAQIYLEVNQKIDAALLPMWATFIEIPSNPALAQRYLEFVRDILFARITPASLNFEFMYAICLEAKEICYGFINASDGMSISRKSA